jgi:hypothetical protein
MFLRDSPFYSNPSVDSSKRDSPIRFIGY